MKPYQQIIIQDCGEPLVKIPLETFVVETPHAYQKLGAPYHLSAIDSPYYLRQSVLERLLTAQLLLQDNYPNWKILIFDAYRPVEVQQFMVDYSFNQLLKERRLNQHSLSAEQHQSILTEVYQFWAAPSLDPATPPPHSTGAALDITLVNETGTWVNMGSEIDEISPRSYPNYFENSSDPTEQNYHQNRQILSKVMKTAGFQQHPNEWWHFSWGDQLWAWLTNQQQNKTPIIAKYGRYLC
ncbi:D-alanyl-D-alanine dipeptidase [Planktothrix tepida]|uniref:D-alanyl-D-alanine dipeptidase n=2 Tax=Planktothrix TaxID=54304 RepID=A0A1J1LMP6_9CYAN|nr:MULTISPECIES: M15 family metallopeptidase [Planktothrix]CAD5922029.1 D-alanyl-D-alanine dipeptidase [Planktothrix pseudagardhii]CAD5980974.1 D-alanyl-D-alanine dipeptidase [Planktothrix tepida]CUR33719.1 D-alanyl-D-alanine dipeptidase [Planktothrix tepida PCC 9214]